MLKSTIKALNGEYANSSSHLPKSAEPVSGYENEGLLDHKNLELENTQSSKNASYSQSPFSPHLDEK